MFTQDTCLFGVRRIFNGCPVVHAGGQNLSGIFPVQILADGFVVCYQRFHNPLFRVAAGCQQDGFFAHGLLPGEGLRFSQIVPGLQGETPLFQPPAHQAADRAVAG